jgi:hypothetical protein
MDAECAEPVRELTALRRLCHKSIILLIFRFMFSIAPWAVPILRIAACPVLSTIKTIEVIVFHSSPPNKSGRGYSCPSRLRGL